MDLAKMKETMSQYDIITFDVFDTLITRCVVQPVDVFKIAEARAKKDKCVSCDFFKDRQAAEQMAYQEYGEKANHDDIYQLLEKEFDYSAEDCEYLKELEFNTELRLAVPRKQMLELVDHLLGSGKRVLLCSDMYLSGEQIRRLLVRCGYPETLELWVSNELGASKGSGALWAKLFDYLPEDKRVIHVGDNEWSDYRSLKQLGKEAFLIDSGYAAFQKSKMAPYLSKYMNGELGNSLVLGFMINKACFNSPFEDGRSTDDVEAIWMGYPFACFMDWLVEQRDDSLLLFITREGYLFKPLYEKYCAALGISEQDNYLFYASRAAAIAASIRSEEDVLAAVSMSYNGTLGHFLKSRMNYILDDASGLSEMEISLPTQKRKVMSALRPYLAEIIERGQVQWEAYRAYIEQVRGSGQQRLTVVDIGYSGTTQYALSKILSEPVNGLYVYLNDWYEQFHSDSAFHCMRKTTDGKAHPIADNLLFLEAAMQVPYGQLQKMELLDGVVTPAFNSDRNFSEAIPLLHERMSGFVEWTAEWKCLAGNDLQFDFNLAEAIWICLLYFEALPEKLLEGFWFADDFNGSPAWRYDSENKVWRSQIGTTPIVFTLASSFSAAGVKYKIKNLVKRYIPRSAYESARQIWVRYIK